MAAVCNDTPFTVEKITASSGVSNPGPLDQKASVTGATWQAAKMADCM